MPNISDMIENYLKSIIDKNKYGYVEIRRNELANMFNCAPSQINYVLSTRFTINHGFIIKSRRGGGGYVRVKKIPLEDSVDWWRNILDLIGDSIEQQEAVSLIKRLLDEKLITFREYKIMESVMDKLDLKVERKLLNRLRAELLKSMIAVLCTESDALDD
ncbi:CtsR family transcriptional regulator [Peptococcaceae bacterium]|nr:CtsR family transcriptional regulator [Peptococcaceae bacterium]MCL0062780.1 CtsR family transcriptional regulator [Peptococcaceae bacterium]MCL0100451.1 CtsR family transcriptional regulator [Peptococcaceae bacterium]MCL0106678.1 CtsR family transcriptional regulator [Peptococcaceae bacterium]